MDIIRTPISKDKLKHIAKDQFGDFVKAVVDIRREIMAIGGELHADEEVLLIEDGSQQQDVWGINLYPEKFGKDFLEFNSMINIRPSQHNLSRGVEDQKTRERIEATIKKLIT